MFCDVRDIVLDVHDGVSSPHPDPPSAVSVTLPADSADWSHHPGQEERECTCVWVREGGQIKRVATCINLPGETAQ